MPIVPLFNISLDQVRNQDNITFKIIRSNNESKISSSNPYMKAILFTFAQNFGTSLSFNQIVDFAAKFLNTKETNLIESEIKKHAFELYFKNYMMLYNYNINPKKDLDLSIPKVYPLAIFQVEQGQNWVTNKLYEKIYLDEIERTFVRFMNGKNITTVIAKLSIEFASKNNIQISKDFFGKDLYNYTLEKLEYFILNKLQYISLL
jgi:methyltransferase-like protein